MKKAIPPYENGYRFIPTTTSSLRLRNDHDEKNNDVKYDSPNFHFSFVNGANVGIYF
ncbi:hypothetical protein [uncultured Sunxiuqinia sp.]|uniref:hypothetical protein n=1 Tax=uncultured Sunxiuqinia sp. TaxID=1573825 RepID=UPI002AA8C415|nr:hypothetical protein [uncultured Sunxiuqinia sp.]